MRRYYSPSAGGFYVERERRMMPADAVDITTEDHVHLQAQQGVGRRIVADSGVAPDRR